MKNNYALMASVDNEVKKTKKGYQVLEEHILKCANCGKDLIQILKVQENDQIQEIESECPFCGDSSFVKEVSGKIYIYSLEGVVIIDSPTECIETKDPKDMNIYKRLSTYIKVKKNV